MELRRWFQAIKLGDRISPALVQGSTQQMLAVISIFHNRVSPHSLGILSITQNISPLPMFESVAKFYKPVNANTGPMNRDLPANRMAHLQERAS